MERIFVPSNKPEDWRSLLAEPEKHWRYGYSAMALAYCWQEAGGFPDCVKKVFSSGGPSLEFNPALGVMIPKRLVVNLGMALG